MGPLGLPRVVQLLFYNPNRLTVLLNDLNQSSYGGAKLIGFCKSIKKVYQFQSSYTIHSFWSTVLF